MAISFPILLSTVPLYTVRETSLAELKTNRARELTEQDLQRNLFSDGGICSNFPTICYENAEDKESHRTLAP